MAMEYFVGWDVGGWNCSKNRNSRDAIVILDTQGQIIGLPWRGNLSSIIHDSSTQKEFINALFDLCKTEYIGGNLTLAIDTPLGFSQDLCDLITGKITDCDTASALNPYLFRHTERYLAEWGYTPLSAIKDMIGSQSTKGIHTLTKFIPNIKETGIWQDSDLTAIEAYPSPCVRSALILELQQKAGLSWIVNETGHDLICDKLLPTQDHVDAFVCALIAQLFVKRPDTLNFPDEGTPKHEGWIFLPKDCFNDKNRKPQFLECG
ncbi:hypothetical protein RS130_22150 [Paraglaciecola aquimarina]|uniref:DUF429 domain-containing protein n=1 Tax=Paraglaciecola aquimarina TaxID=1235557 RepID=A0ABU3T1X0_9ALTE|nr:hypothetical protein [Paraglaciecola aquimarina]MDU0356225.1 hypothetical protein [Paraglaciecola aquimarina]